MSINVEALKKPSKESFRYFTDEVTGELICINEYLEHKKIEKEIGIDLILRNRIENKDFAYIKEPNGTIIKGEVEGFSAKRKAFIVRARKELNNVLIDCPINDLGKTWALEKDGFKNVKR